jgi:hypothetical protein
MKTKISENDVKKEIMDLLACYKPYLFVWKQNTQGTFNAKKGTYYFHGLAGVPDIIGFTVYGRFIGIEVKAPGKKSNQSSGQKAFQDKCNKFGGIYILADSVDDVLPWLNKIKRGEN